MRVDTYSSPQVKITLSGVVVSERPLTSHITTLPEEVSSEDVLLAEPGQLIFTFSDVSSLVKVICRLVLPLLEIFLLVSEVSEPSVSPDKSLSCLTALSHVLIEFELVLLLDESSLSLLPKAFWPHSIHCRIKTHHRSGPY